ncbi:l-aminoadipate-semialdehyde dehydrogenase-phosphopantetheinyl transferase [Anaeramoeba ignava]|uniref:holo-[acyl-carrier-protein] synthase n=1 Tax=Anaeramoeba ignava TaxID=1746090 RepID=A0A9Q0R683_ANAIG|nr:l-aminoadipate-semialdehyde dehydrogenase-phosphopantetheinyl transferase [Anaeramoeba ignava]
MKRIFIDISKWNCNEKNLKTYFDFIQIEEQQRIRQFYRFEDKKRSLAGRLLLKFKSSEIYGKKPKQLEFGRTIYGKPYLIEHSEFEANISHHSKYVIFGFEEFNCQIGVDVVEIKEEKEENQTIHFFQDFQECFTKKEWEQILQPLQNKDKFIRFFWFWSLKESFIKADGKGLSFGLFRIEFIINWESIISLNFVRGGISKNDPIQLFIDGVFSSDWIFESTFIDNSFIFSVCFKNVNHLLNFDEIPFQNFEEISIDEMCSKMKEK